MIQLNTLGDAVIKVGHREVRPTSPAVFAALLYLGVERGKRVPRAALQELLFPETDERSGAHSLRQLLYKLRQLGASVHAEGDVVWLAPEDVVDDYSAPAHTNGNGNAKAPSAHGAFLAGYSPKVSAAYDEWLESRRTTIGVLRRRELIKQMLARRDAADWTSVERIAQEVLASDPFNDEATLALAESTALSGSKSEAIRILERYESETGSADLKLPASILRKRISERLPDRRRRALDTPFVGRDAEAEIMRQAVVQLRAGQGGSVVISGEPGIGKTRLIEETTALALLEGVNVHIVRCQPHYVNRPMGVFIEWVPQLLSSRGALGVAPETLEYLKLLTSHKDDRAHRPTDARDDSTRAGVLLAAVRDLVDAVASEAPILLVVEDAHWADSTSLRELCVILERRRSASLLTVHSARTLEPLREGGVLVDSTPLVRLKPLTASSALDLSRQLLSATEEGEPPAEMHQWCAQVSGGNPLFIQMLCAHYEDTRQPFAVPPSLRSTTLRRIEQLSLESRRLLEVCALLGRYATLPALRDLMNVGPHVFLHAVQRLEEHGYLRTTGSVAHLSHDLLRECALELIPPLTRRLLHASVASHLESQYEATGDSSVLWDCAEHWAASGDNSKTLAFLRSCARHSAHIGRAIEALQILKGAKRFAESGQDTLALLEETSRCGKAANDWKAVIDAEASLQQIHAFRSNSARHSDTELNAVEGRWLLDYDSSDAVARLLQCAGAIDAPATHRADAAFLLLRIAYERGDFELAANAYGAVRPVLDPTSKIVSNRLTQLLYHTSFGDTSEATRLAFGLRDDLDDFDMAYRFRAARNTIVAFSFLGLPDVSVDVGRKYHDLAKRLDLRIWESELASHCCYSLLIAGDFDAATDWYRRAAMPNRPLIGLVSDMARLFAGIEIALYSGDKDGARRFLREIEAMPVGESVRSRALMAAYQVLVAQIDPNYRCNPATLEHLLESFQATKRLACAASVVLPIGEDFARSGSYDRLTEVLRDFFGSVRPGLGYSKRITRWAEQLHISPIVEQGGLA